MEKNCGNCKYWGTEHEKEQTYSNSRYCQMTGEMGANLNIITLADCCCPRFTEKDQELPQELKDWKPEWHKDNSSITYFEENEPGVPKMHSHGYWIELPK